MDYPEWADDKQIEGMKEFMSILQYGSFDVEFRQSQSYSEFFGFNVVLKWENHSYKDGLGTREHTFRIAWNYEEILDQYYDKIDCWQFIFACGDASREMTTEVLFLDLFFFLDGIAKI